MNCTDSPASEWPDIEPGAKELHYVDFTAKLSRFWKPDTDFSTTTAVRPRFSTGLQYRAQSGGHTAQREPLWPKTLAGTVVDGGVTWVAEAISTTSLITTVLSIVWTPPAAIVATGATLSGQIASALLYTTSAQDGIDYEILVTALCADTQSIVKRCVLPVRKARRVCEC